MSRILIVDDHPVLLEGLALMLTQHDQMVVAKCSNVSDALDAEAEHKPDIIVADLSLGQVSGLAMLEQLRSVNNKVNFILYTGQISGSDARRAIEGGANAIVSKEASPLDIIHCIEAIESGQNWFDRSIMNSAMSAGKGPAEWASLSPAEQRIARLTVEGMPNRQIAEKTGLVEGTVKVHLNRIFRKLGISSRMALIRDFRDAG